MPRPLKRVEHLSKPPEPTPAERPELWTHHQCRTYAQEKGLIYKDRAAIERHAQGLGLEVRPLMVAPALIRAIAVHELEQGTP